MTTTTKKPVYRWEKVNDSEHKLKKLTDDSFEVVAEVRFGDSWGWRRPSYIWSSGWPHIDDAKAACEKALGVTTDPEEVKGQEGQPAIFAPGDKCPKCSRTLFDAGFGTIGLRCLCGYATHGGQGTIERCPTCLWPMMADPKDGCTLGNCSQRPVPKKQADQPPVIIPPNDFADALDAHAKKVVEEDADARHASAMAQQVGGSHYRLMKIQPAEFIHANSIPHRESSAIELLCRWRAKNGIEDLRKAIHQIELLINLEEISQWKATASRAVVGKGKAGA